MSEMVAGQRWVSNSEPELGLGLVLELMANRVTILFLACNERRVYARDNAPLTRVRFSIGDSVETDDGLVGSVINISEQTGILSYQLLNATGEKVWVEEMMLSHHLQFNKPQDRLFMGQAETGRCFTLRYETWQHLFRLQKSHVAGLLGARAALIPHQLYIAHEVAKRECVRVMLADEVGLGKTIEAGLILQNRLHLGLSSRVLIVVPESLLHQWLVEMLRRFNLRFSLLDEARCEAIEEDNPFLSEQLVLCSIDFFEQSEQRREQALQADWDVVVIDEAHHLRWDEQVPSVAYQFVEQLSLAVAGLILLTATPEQLGKQSHFAQLRLLDADRFHDFEAFLAEEERFAPIAALADKIVSGSLLNENNKRLLAQLVDADLCVRYLQQDIEGSETVRQLVLDQLVDRHGTGRILFRNSRQVVQGFPERKFHAYPLPSLGHDEQDYLQWLVAKIKSLEGKQILLICKQAEMVVRLHKALRNQFAINAAMFHERMSIVERDRTAAYFSDADAHVSILLCSEIGSEGRNFQFVHHLILLDLPENPDLLQQRIGRLDRIGQKHIIQIHVPYIVGSQQHSLCRWYAEGLRLFQLNSNAASEVYRLQREQVKQVCLSDGQQGLDNLVSNARKLMLQVEAKMHQSRDLLLELNSCRHDVAEKLMASILSLSQPQVLWQYMENVFDYFGVESEHHSQDCAILHAGQMQRISQFPYVPEEGVTVTVARSIALAREDMQYLTWEHPMVVAAMDLVLSGNVGNAALSVVRHAHLPEGRYLLECLFLVECSAPASLQLSRFLPVTPLRVLIDQDEVDLTESILYEDLQEVVHQFDKDQVSAFIVAQNKAIKALLALAETQAISKMQTLVAVAKTQMLEVAASEIKRLQALRLVNPSIKVEEINQRKEQARAAHAYIESAKLRLDAVRFIISV